MSEAAVSAKPAPPRELYELRFGRFMLGFAIAWGGIFAAWAFVAIFKSWWAWLIAVPIIGVQQNALGNLLHDAFHWRVHASRRVNEIFARWLLAGPVMLPLASGRASHLTHHRLLGKPDDPDRLYHGNNDKPTLAQFGLYLFMLFSGLQFLRVGLKVLFGRKSKADQVNEEDGGGPPNPTFVPDLASIALAQLILFALLWLITRQWWAYGVLWLLPMTTVFVGLNSLRSFAEHVEYTLDDGSEKPRLYTTPSFFPESYIVAPFNMNHHAEHHHYVGVPYYNLPRLRKWFFEAYPQPPFEIRATYAGTVLQYIRSLPLKKPEAPRG